MSSSNNNINEEDTSSRNDDIFQDYTGNGTDEEPGEIKEGEMFLGETEDVNRYNSRATSHVTRRITEEEYKKEGKESCEAFESKFKEFMPLIESIRRTKYYNDFICSARTPSSSSVGGDPDFLSSSMREKNKRHYHSSSNVRFDDKDSDNLSDSQTTNLFTSHRRDVNKREDNNGWGRNRSRSRSGSRSRRSSNRFGSSNRGGGGGGGGVPFCRRSLCLDSVVGTIFVLLGLVYLFYAYVWVGNLSCYNAKSNFELIELRCYSKVRQNILDGEAYSTEKDKVLNDSYLHKAAQVGGVELGDFLVSRHPELVNDRNFAGDTPLHVAVRNNHPEFVKFLLLNGASCSARNRNDLVPMDYSKNPEVDAIMREYCKQNPDDPPPPPSHQAVDGMDDF